MPDYEATTTSVSGRITVASATKTVLRDIGALQVLIGGSMFVSMLVSLLYQEWYSAPAFLSGAGITVAASSVAYKLNEDVPEPQRHHAMIVAALGWAVTALFGALLFVSVTYITLPVVLNSFVPARASPQSSLLYFQKTCHPILPAMKDAAFSSLLRNSPFPASQERATSFRTFLRESYKPCTS